MTLEKFFRDNPKLALAFSGGADSSYLLYAAKSSGADVCAYYVNTEFQPQFELDDAERIAAEIGARLRVIKLSVLSEALIAENGERRCYHCKRLILKNVAQAAAEDGYRLIIDGSNASDIAGDRPGMAALKELSVRSPLMESGITKSELRRLSKEAGLSTWNKPAYSCLATRIPCGTAISAEALGKTEIAENALSEMGFSDLRVRLMGDIARIELPADQMPALIKRRGEVLHKLLPHYKKVVLDLEDR